MKSESFADGVYPVMLTPFTDDNKVDYQSLARLIDWYIDNGVAGLFANCQSSEMFFLTLEERVALARFIVKHTEGRVPVLVSGHISDLPEDQIAELNAMAEAGADALILITNRLAAEEDDDQVWFENLQNLLENLPADIPLGFYECPYPYKRLISDESLKWCAESGRFFFMKDTCCDLEIIERRLKIIQGSPMKLFNANTSTLLETLKAGGHGFSGVMANFHPKLYTFLISEFKNQSDLSEKISDFLTIASMIERQVYPVNAKYYQKMIGNFSSIHTRVKKPELLNETCMLEVKKLDRITRVLESLYLT